MCSQSVGILLHMNSFLKGMRSSCMSIFKFCCVCCNCVAMEEYMFVVSDWEFQVAIVRTGN
jgi:hypothetical protein